MTETFSLAGRHKVLYIPPVLGLLCGGFVFLALILLLGGRIAVDPALRLMCVLALLFVQFLLSALLFGALSWMVLQVASGKRASFGQGFYRALAKGGSLLLCAIVGLLVLLVGGQLRKKDDEQNFLTRALGSVFAGALATAWDIASHLMLPATVLTKNDFDDAAKEMPSMLGRIPQVVAGGFAFDIVARWLYTIELVLAVAFWLIFVGLWPVFASYFAITLFVVLALLTHILYSFTKSVHFTLLYIDLHPQLKKSCR